MRKFTAAIAAAAVAASVSSAAIAGEVISRVDVAAAYDVTDARAGLGPQAPVIVQGASAEDARRVAENLRLPSWFASVDGFAPIAEAGDRDTYFVIAFAPAGRTNGPALCHGEHLAGEGSPEVAYVALCRGENTLSEGRVWSPALGAPEAADFTRAFRRLFVEIAPQDNLLRLDSFDDI